MDRRGFLKSILAAGVAPAFVGASVLMPVRKLIVPERVVWTYMGADYGFGEGSVILTAFTFSDGKKYMLPNPINIPRDARIKATFSEGLELPRIEIVRS